jgi:acyl-CoA carboxylase subunit beta
MTAARSTPDAADATDWLVCADCRSMLYGPRFRRHRRVCPDCGHHAALTAPERVADLFDDGSAASWEPTATDVDPLGFVDSRPYPQRVAEARARTGLDEGVLCVRGAITGRPVVAAVMDFRFLGGSLGSAVGERITAAAEAALAERTPLLLVCASGGARMQEGVLALMQMAKTVAALRALDEAGVLTISLVTDPTYGGVAASFATFADVVIAEPGARLGFAGRRVIEQTIREDLPAGFQTAEFLLERGMLDMIVARAELRTTLGRLLGAAATGGPRPVRTSPLVTDHEALPERDPWDSVRRARRLGRPTTLDYLTHVVEDFVELHGDRRHGDDPAIVAGLGRLDGRAVAVVGTQKGHDAATLAARGYGMSGPAGYRKAARVMTLAAKLGLPVVTLIDTAGAYPGVAAEEQGQALAIAENLGLMASLPVPTVAVVTGEGGSGGALALAVADRVLACANAVYSVISPEGCASILWKDAAEAPRAAAALQVDARALLRLGIADGVLPEPGEGADTDHVAAARTLRDAVSASLQALEGLDGGVLVAARRARFRRYGAETAVDAAVPALDTDELDGTTETDAEPESTDRSDVRESA